MRHLYLPLILLFLASILSAQELTQKTSLPEMQQQVFPDIKTIIPSDVPGNSRQETFWPLIWDIPVNSGVIHAMIILLEANPRINDIELEQGDFIGCFYTDDNGDLKCGGADFWLDTANIIFSVFGDDNSVPEKTGFYFNEQIYFKVFKWETYKEYDVDILSFSPESLSEDHWFPLGLSTVDDLQALEVMDFYVGVSADPICLGDELTLSAEEFIGTNGNYTYSWSSDPPGLNSSQKFPPPVYPVINTTYMLVVEDGINVSTHNRLITVNEFPLAFAGEDAVICENQNFIVSGSAENYSETLWATSGDGTFLHAELLETTYFPGTADIMNGQAVLTLTAIPLSPCVVSDSDNLILTVQNYPGVNAGSGAQLCLSEQEYVELSATATNYSSVAWTTEGDGTFEGVNTLTPKYYPGSYDYSEGFVDLEICVQAANPCVMEVCDEVTLTFTTGPTCNAPSGITRCENIPVQLAGAASNYAGLLWTTQGDGTFSDPTIINPKYFGGPLDKLNGGTVVTLNALADPPCTINTSKDVNITLKPLPRLVTFGQETDILCPDENYLQINAQVDHTTGTGWSTNGDGTFTSTSTLNPKYYPGAQDYQNGYLELVLTASPVTPCNVSVDFILNTVIAEPPEVNIITNPGTASCGSRQLDAEVFYASSFNWQTSGDGTFDDPQSLTPEYFPGPVDLNSPQSVSLSLTAFPMCASMGNAIGSVNLFFQDDVSVYAGPDADICETDPYNLSGASASDFSGLTWSTTGDGNFNDPTIINPSYFPGTGDIQAGEVVLTITGQPVAPCVLADEDMMTLTISRAPIANAGNDGLICSTDDFAITGASADHFDALEWETSGDGTFSNPSLINPIYFPGPADISSGLVTLTMSAAGVSPCNFTESDVLSLSIQKIPLVDAGADVNICETSSFFISGASASNYDDVFWSSNGDGTFNNPGVVKPFYFPGPADIQSGVVQLTITGEAIAPCTVPDVDVMILSVTKAPEANAGSDALICSTDNFAINGASASYFSTIEWETSGDGTFSNPGLINPEYYPGTGDKFSGNVNLTINASGINPCGFTESDMLTLSIQKAPTVNAGNDITSCASVFIAGSAANYSSLLWTTSGDGTFSNPSATATFYFPGTQDYENLQVNIELAAEPVLPCQTVASDMISMLINTPVIINDNVSDMEVTAGQAIQMSFETANPQLGTFQWFRNGVLVAGQNDAVYYDASASPQDAGEYHCVFSNPCGIVESGYGMVQVLQPGNQLVLLPAGWRGISSYVEPNQTNVPLLLVPIASKLVIISDGTDFYWPEQSINTLGPWTNQQGYRIKTSSSGLLSISGVTRYPVPGFSIPPGWSYLPVNSPCQVSVASYFAGIPEIGMIKEMAGPRIYWPEYGINTLGTLFPGNAYQALNTSSDDLFIKYPSCLSKSGWEPEMQSSTDYDSPWNTITPTFISHSIVINTNALKTLNEGDIIGAFSESGICYGFTEISSKTENHVLVIFGDDPTTQETEGFIPDETLLFKVFEASTRKTHAVIPGFDQSLPDASGTFVSDGMSMIRSFTGQVTGIEPGKGSGISVFPNPGNGIFHISGIEGRIEYEILDIRGRVISSGKMETTHDLNLTEFPAGMYYLKLELVKGSSITKLVKN